jgi:dihydrofolate reductase
MNTCSLNAIVCIDNNGGIGKNGKLVNNIPADLRRFRQKTSRGDCNVLIMGRKTYESIGRPLPGRVNIVLSRNKMDIKGVTIANNVDEVMSMLRTLKMSDVDDNVFVIGGSEIYKQFEPYVKNLYVTRVFEIAKCDTFYKIDQSFNIVNCSRIFEYKGVGYRYETMFNTKVSGQTAFSFPE